MGNNGSSNYYSNLKDEQMNDLRKQCNDLRYDIVLLECDLQNERAKVAELTLELEKIKGKKTT